MGSSPCCPQLPAHLVPNLILPTSTESGDVPMRPTSSSLSTPELSVQISAPPSEAIPT